LGWDLILETFVDSQPLSNFQTTGAPTILLVELSKHKRDRLTSLLKARGFSVFTAQQEQDVLHIVSENQPDLMVMRHVDGLIGTAFRLSEIIDQPLEPLIAEACLDVDIDVIVGLKVGRDKYIVIPAWLTQLLLQPQSLNSRVNMNSSTTELFAGDLRLNLVGRRVFKGDREIHLSPREFELLATFINQQGEVLSREDLLEQVWGPNFKGGLRTVDVHVHWLRAKLEHNLSEPQRIVTVRGVGYLFRSS
jgi:DNA-binding response OmpR family regulator